MNDRSLRDDADRLRLRQDDADIAASLNPGVVAHGAPCFVGKTTTVATYPASAATYFAMLAVTVTGTETEGGSGILTAGTDVTYALNLGTAIPPSGTYVICTLVDYRWTFRYDG